MTVKEFFKNNKGCVLDVNKSENEYTRGQYEENNIPSNLLNKKITDCRLMGNFDGKLFYKGKIIF